MGVDAHGDTTSTAVRSSVVAALLEGRGVARGEVGIAAIALNNPTLVLCQLSDSRTYVRTEAKLKMLDPVEILMPTGSMGSAMEAGASMTSKPSKLFQVI